MKCSIPKLNHRTNKLDLLIDWLGGFLIHNYSSPLEINCFKGIVILGLAPAGWLINLLQTIC